MKRIPLNDETIALARRLIWFEPPSEALASPARFMAYAFARATHEEMNILRSYLDEADFLEALDAAPPASRLLRCLCGGWDNYAGVRSRASTLATKSPIALR